MGYITIPPPESVSGDCPHCGKGVRFVMHHADRYAVSKDGTVEPAGDAMTQALRERGLRLRTYHCPACDGLVMELVRRVLHAGGDGDEEITRLFPRDVLRNPPAEVTNEEIRRDYREAHASRTVSRRGAAALARRALQNALREKGFTAPSKKLVDEIDAADASSEMGSTLREKLHFVRKVGNDGAHPNYDHAGEIVDVTEDELVMLLETLDEFFDVFYVRPARHKAVMAARDARLKGTSPDRK